MATSGANDNSSTVRPHASQSIRGRRDNAQVVHRCEPVAPRGRRWLSSSPWALLPLVALTLGLGTGCQAFHRFAGRGSELTEYHRWEQGARDAMRHDRLDRAEAYLTKAMALAPNDVQVLEQYADLCVRRGDAGRAIEVLTRAVDVSGGDPELRVKLGQCFLDHGHWLPASRQAQLALDANRQCASAWVLKGRVMLAKEEYSDALACFQRALSLQPGQPDVHGYLAETHVRMNEPMRAISCLEQLLSQYPVGQQPEAALLAVGELLSGLGRHHAAIEKLSLAVAQREASPRAWMAFAQAQLKGGYRRQAVATLEKAAEQFPTQEPISRLLVAYRQGLEPNSAVLQSAWQPAFPNDQRPKR